MVVLQIWTLDSFPFFSSPHPPPPTPPLFPIYLASFPDRDNLVSRLERAMQWFGKWFLAAFFVLFYFFLLFPLFVPLSKRSLSSFNPLPVNVSLIQDWGFINKTIYLICLWSSARRMGGETWFFSIISSLRMPIHTNLRSLHCVISWPLLMESRISTCSALEGDWGSWMCIGLSPPTAMARLLRCHPPNLAAHLDNVLMLLQRTQSSPCGLGYMLHTIS